MVGPAAKREAVAHLRSVFQMSERRACSVIAADRTSSGIAPVDRATRCCEGGCAILPMHAAASAIVGSSSCCDRRASLWAKPDLPALSRGRAERAPTPGPAACRRDASADPGRGQGKCTLVARLRPRSVRQWSSLPHSQRRRRCHAGMSGSDSRHVDLRQAGRPGTDHADRAAWQAAA